MATVTKDEQRWKTQSVCIAVVTTKLLCVKKRETGEGEEDLHFKLDAEMKTPEGWIVEEAW